ncbi:MAG: molybdenum cofactor biosynthesis protein MoaE [Chloroherpetonaceae bacterium]
MITISDKPLDVQSVIEAVQTHEAGAINVFIGTVRNQTAQKNVVGLDYEAFETMAIKKMHEIAEEAKAKFPVLKVAIAHRVGKLKLGEIAVVIAVATPHRAESFAACKFIIDTLKEVVPIWKKEIFEDGDVWVSAHA